MCMIGDMRDGMTKESEEKGWEEWSEQRIKLENGMGHNKGIRGNGIHEGGRNGIHERGGKRNLMRGEE